MKKYNLSQIMKRAWELVKKAPMTMSAALKKAWSEAKGSNFVTMCYRENETFTVNTITGVVTGKTYKSRKLLKDDFNAKWDGSAWTVDLESFNRRINAPYYANLVVAQKEIKSEKLVNRYDGFYCETTYTDGTMDYALIG